jgi:hypothetical protein
MKYQTTNKELKQAHNLVSCGYCDLQYALRFLSPNAYVASRAYGWRCDIYEFEGFTIATGYTTPSHALKLPYDLVNTLDNDCKNLNSAVAKDLIIEVINKHLKSLESRK